VSGTAREATWRDPQPPSADFFAAKGVLYGLMETLRAPWTVHPSAQPFLHPGRAATITVNGAPAGWIGEVHPRVAAEWDLPDVVAAFEVNLDAVPEQSPRRYEDVTSFPEVREDLAVIVSESIPAAQVLAVVRRSGAPLLADAEVFDVYHDPERVGEGNVSLALRLTFRAPDRTLTDEEVAARRDAISASLTQELGGRIRAA
jgi:phenylalanyl-tRNA synthetase beta chain